MSEIGSLIISLKAETARFQQDLGKVKRDLNDLQGDASKTGESFNNIGEARGGLMLVEDAVGVRLPRHLNTLIAQIPGVGAAFAAMLPIAGVAVAIGIIGKLIERHNELEKAIFMQIFPHNQREILRLSFDSLLFYFFNAGHSNYTSSYVTFCFLPSELYQ